MWEKETLKKIKTKERCLNEQEKKICASLELSKTIERLIQRGEKNKWKLCHSDFLTFQLALSPRNISSSNSTFSSPSYKTWSVICLWSLQQNPCMYRNRFQVSCCSSQHIKRDIQGESINILVVWELKAGVRTREFGAALTEFVKWQVMLTDGSARKWNWNKVHHQLALAAILQIRSPLHQILLLSYPLTALRNIK